MRRARRKSGQAPDAAAAAAPPRDEAGTESAEPSRRQA